MKRKIMFNLRNPLVPNIFKRAIHWISEGSYLCCLKAQGKRWTASRKYEEHLKQRDYRYL